MSNIRNERRWDHAPAMARGAERSAKASGGLAQIATLDHDRFRLKRSWSHLK
jgi:hypothetical protein